MIKIVHDAGLEDLLVTNGILLTREKARSFIEAGLDYIVFSMSAASRQGYKKIYGVDKFETVIRNLIGFIEERDKSQRQIRVRTVFVDTPDTEAEKEKYLKLLSQIPVDNPSVSPMFNFFGDNKAEAVDLNLMKKEDIPICKIPWKYFSITSNGDIRACMFDVYDRYILGNLDDQKMMTCWNSQRMQDFRQALIDKDFKRNEAKGDLCSKCNQMFMNIKKDHICTSQWPHDFSNEAVKYFEKGSSHLFETMPQEEYSKKMNYLSEHKEEWIKEVLGKELEYEKMH